MNDIFNTMKFQFQSENPFAQNVKFKWESRTAYIGFNYRFSGGKTVLNQEEKEIVMKNKAEEVLCNKKTLVQKNSRYLFIWSFFFIIALHFT